MNKKTHDSAFRDFLLSLMKIGCIGFGGGSALIPVVEQEIIENQKLDTKENLDKDVVVASITSGALPVEIACSLGNRNFGKKGMVLGAVAMALPGTLATILLLTVLSVLQEKVLSVIQVLSVGVSAFIVSLLLHYITGVIKECGKESLARRNKAVVLMGVVFLLVCEKKLYTLIGYEGTPVLALSTIDVLTVAFFCIFYSRGIYNVRHMIVMLLLGGLFLLSHGKAGIITNSVVVIGVDLTMTAFALWGLWSNIQKDNWRYVSEHTTFRKDIGVWLFVLVLFSLPAIFSAADAGLEFLAKGVLSTLMSFGGGDAYLTIADGMFVESGMLDTEQYYGQLVSVVNILPGSILCKTLSGVGYSVGYDLSGSVLTGLFFALEGFVCSIAASGLFFMAVYHLYDQLHALYIFRMVGKWIRPIIAGFLLNVILSLYNQNMVVAVAHGMGKPVMGIVTTVLAAFNFWLLHSRKCGIFKILLMDLCVAAIGILVF